MDDVAALLTQANRLLREGRGGEAMAAFKAVLTARSDLPDAWFNLAYLRRQARAGAAGRLERENLLEKL